MTHRARFTFVNSARTKPNKDKLSTSTCYPLLTLHALSTPVITASAPQRTFSKLCLRSRHVSSCFLHGSLTFDWFRSFSNIPHFSQPQTCAMPWYFSFFPRFLRSSPQNYRWCDSYPVVLEFLSLSFISTLDTKITGLRLRPVPRTFWSKLLLSSLFVLVRIGSPRDPCPNSNFWCPRSARAARVLSQ